MRSATEKAVQKANRQLLAAIRKLPKQPLVMVGVLGSIAFLGSLFLLTSQAAAPGSNVVYFALDHPGHNQSFVIALKNPDRVEAARKSVGKPGTVTGRIVPEQVPYNTSWHFHLDPSSIEFGGQHATTCDVDIQTVQNQLSQVGTSMLPNGVWCPSGVVVLREVKQ